jgi:hypothetical protein
MQHRMRQLCQLVGLSLIAVQVSCVDLSSPDTGGNNQCLLTPTPHAVGDNTAGVLTTSDCRLTDGSFIDYYTTTLPAGAYVFNLSSTELDTYLFLLSAGRSLIGYNNDSQGSTNSTIKALLPAGDFILGANSFPGSTGAYNLSSAVSTTGVTGCEDVFVVRGTSTAQDLQTTDCAANPGYADNYMIALTAGQSITVTMTSSVVDSFLELNYVTGRVAFNDNLTGTSNDAQFTYTPSVSDFYTIRAKSVGSISTGAYTLSISQ